MNKLQYILLEVSKKEEETKWYMKILKKIGDEIKDFGNDFRDFFLMIKGITYDALAEKYGETGVTLVFIAIIIVAIMVIATVIIRGKSE